MSDENNYIKSLISNEKYLEKLRNIYNKMVNVHRFKRRLGEIEKEISWYISNENNMYTPDYFEFYSYAFKNYIPKVDKTIVYSRYKELLGEYNTSDIPGYFYCLILLSHFHDEENAFLNQHGNDLDLYSKSTLLDFNKLHDINKLLYGFLKQIDTLVRVFIDSIDMTEIEHLDDDIKNLDAFAVKHRFMKALHDRDRSMCFKLLGRMRELDEGEDYYFEALAHYINEEYSDAIRYLNKVEKYNIDYHSAVALKLECYTLLGDIDGFIECMNTNNELFFNYWHYKYLLMSLILRLDIEGFLKINDIFNIKHIEFVHNDDTIYLNMLLGLVGDIIVEGIGIIEEKEFVTNSIEGSEISAAKEFRLQQLSIALALFPDEIRKYLDPEYISNKSAEDLKNEVEPELLKLLIYKNPQQSFEITKKALLCQLKLGDVEAFIYNVNLLFENLVTNSENGQKEADELIRLAYIEGSVLGSLDDKIKERVERLCTSDLTQNIKDRIIYNFLSVQGRLAYEAAEWQYIKSCEEDYGWKDAGMLSLAFYRIIEVELNKKIAIPLLSRLGYNTLYSEYSSCKNRYTGEDKTNYIKKWNNNLKTYEEMEINNFSGKGFMLGSLYHFFKAIGSEYDSNDSLGTLIKNNLDEVLNTYGIEKFNEGYFETITNDVNRDKYRNPPAHTIYMPYTTACECRDVFKNTILQLNEMLK